MTNVLISYTSTDRPWAEWLAWVLEENGSTVTPQAWDFPVGSNFVMGMEQAIADGQTVLFVLSENYLRSTTNQEEWSQAFAFISKWMSESILDISGNPSLNQQPVANSATAKQRQLEERHAIRQAEWRLRNEKLKSLQEDLVIEASVSVRFQLEQQIQVEETALVQLNENLGQIEQALASEQGFPTAQTLFPSYKRQLIPIRVEDVKSLGVLSKLVYIDLVDKSEVEAAQAILAVLQERSEGDRSSVADAPTTPEEPIQVDESDNGQLKLERRYHTVQLFVEQLTDDIGIEMMQIPAGTFFMGSPEDEPERSGAEGPQHEVNVATFFMGKYPITQAQWRAVAALPQASRELNPDPSKFKGEKRPVDHVSWYDAVEFCARLSAYTDRSYRLPTEVEWEYACRAGTTTPFHFGETITTDLANYRGTNDEEYKWSGSYDRGPKGKYREETTPVDYFGNANPFGLCDMHGNVWEWCQDHWHDNYENAPADSSAWLTSNKNADRVLRGGSWIHAPRDCRSANRCDNLPDNRYDDFSLRVVCSAPTSIVPLIAAVLL